ncbi:MAG: type II toxin-antitoxin system PemK/MazF family toxin [Patescibacteria group bacterium]
MPKGTIVLVPFPFTDLSGQKVRPALALYDSRRGEDCIVAFISSLKTKTGIFDVRVKLSLKNGLKIDSAIKVDKIATLQKKIVLGELGVLESQYLSLVNKKLKQLFGI